MGGSGGGGETQSQVVDTPQVSALKTQAAGQIAEMLNLNPLSKYAAWQPREIAGSNPFYEQMFQTAPTLGNITPAMATLYGGGPTQVSGGQPMQPMQAPPLQGQAGGSGTVFGVPMSSFSQGGQGSGLPQGGVTVPQGGITPQAPQGFTPVSIQQVVDQQVQNAIVPAVNKAMPFRNQWVGDTWFDSTGQKFPTYGHYQDEMGRTFVNAGSVPSNPQWIPFEYMGAS